MIKNLIPTLLLVIATSCLMYAQPPSNCEESEDQAVCDLDDVNGAMFTNPPPGTVDVPSEALCNGGAFHNPGWFSFVAGSQDIQLTVTPMMCDTVNQGGNPLFGVQVALWEGCPDGGGMCVAGDANCSDQPITLNASGLTIGDIYNLTIDGCAGSVCTVTISIDASQPFDIPDVDDVELADPEYNVRGGCESGLDDGIFCAGIEVLFTINEELYEELGAEWTWTMLGLGGAADESTIEWSSGGFSGMGSPAVIGDLNGELGAYNVSMVFTEPGVYEICLTEVVSECETTNGNNCIEITIITPGLQDFGEYRVCVLDLVQGWEVPEEDPNGNTWGSGEITLQQVMNAPDGIIELMVMDDCGCEFTQRVRVIPVGSLDREDVTLYLLPCQLPYSWFDIEIDNFMDYQNPVEEVLTEGSNQRDWDGDRCDSLITLNVVELQAFDTIIIGDCTPMGTEFTIEITLFDDSGNEFDILNPDYEWIDSTTNTVVGTGQVIFLETGVYYVNISSFVEDLNYTDLSGTNPESPCNFLFGPYDLEGGSSQEPDVMAYDTTLCSDQLTNVIFVIDTVPNTNYNWIVPAGIPFTISAGGDSLYADWTNALPTDTIMVAAENDCGVSEAIDLPIEVIDGNDPLVTSEPEECVDNEFMVTFGGVAADIVSYNWDFGTGVISSGANNTPGPIGVTYPTSGAYTFSLTVVDLGGCESSASFGVDIIDPLDAPTIMCAGDQNEIVFDWADVGADSYLVNELTIPPGATGTMTGPTSYTITGLNPNDLAEIEVIAESSGPCGNVSSILDCNASSCNLPDVPAINFSDMSFCQNNIDNAILQFEHAVPMGITGTYIGNGVIDADMGLFNPNDPSLVLGPNVISFTYMDQNCSETENITITINEMPVADFSPSAMSVCQNEIFTLDNFNNDPNGVWDYDAGAMGDFTGLSYNDPGMKTIKLVVVDPVTLCGDSLEVQVEVLQNIIAPIVLCTPDIDNVNFNWQDIVGASSYTVEVLVNGMVFSTGDQPNSDFLVSSLNQGDVVDITVTVEGDNGCGMFTVTQMCEAQTCAVPDIQLSAPQNSFCTNDNLSVVNITTMVDGNPETGIYQGPGVANPNVNQFDPMLAGVGMHTVTFSYTNPADNCVTTESIDFEILDPPTPSFTLDNNAICIDETAIVTGEMLPANVNESWNANTLNFVGTGNPNEFEVSYDTPGSFDISLSYSITGCPPIEVEQTIMVTDTITFPTLRCENAGTDFIEIGWNDQANVDDYEIYVNGVLETNQSNPDIVINNLDPGTMYTLTVIAIDNECGSREISIDCMTPNCVPPTIVSNIPSTQCYTPGSGPIQLDISVTTNTGTQGTYTWDPPLIIDDNDMFTPSSGDATYNFNLVYTEGNCESIEPVSFTINEIPQNTLDLSADQQVICISSSASVSAVDASITDEVANWDFGDNTIVNASGSGFGPYDLTFNQSGSYPISLTVDNDGCLSEDEMVTIIVEDELTPPVVNCGSQGVFELDFTWDSVDCATDYNVFVDGSLATTTQGTSFMVDGLSELQSVDIVVEAVSECACSSVMSQQISCSTVSCPTTTFSVSSFDNTICLDGTASSFNISATPDDLTGNGSGVWSGGPVANASGTIDPSLVTAGTYQLNYDYDESGCSYNFSTEITFVEAPTLNVIEEVDPTCITDNVGYINVAGSGGMSGYMYSLDQGTPQTSGEFSSVAPGTHVISIEDANGCVNNTTVNITGAINPSASIDGPSTVILDNDATYTLVTNAPNIDDIIWTLNGIVVCQGPSCLSYTISGAQSDASLDVQVLFNGNCEVSASFAVDVKEIQAFYVPNIFSPTTNTGNSTWKIFIKGSETFFKSIKVYNRWGNLVHDFTNPDQTGNLTDVELWDGYIDDSPAITEVYVYVLEIEIEEIPRLITGNVTIVR